jgi:hypothetical protein
MVFYKLDKKREIVISFIFALIDLISGSDPALSKQSLKALSMNSTSTVAIGP